MNSSSRAIVHEAVRSVALRLGIELEVKPVIDGEFDFQVRLSNYDAPRGFGVSIREDYLSWTLAVKFDSESRPLLAIMRDFAQERSSTFVDLLEAVQGGPDKFSLSINGKNLGEAQTDREWLNFEVFANVSHSGNSKEELTSALTKCLSLPLSLLMPPDWDELEGSAYRPEGEAREFVGTKYERSRFNRALCLEYFGFDCQGCGLQMEQKYGPLGQGVIHVHHLVPVSRMGGSYRLDPKRDLIPLCPNCHNVVHRQDPPLEIGQLREITGYKV